MKIREEFESVYPIGKTIYWNEEAQCYVGRSFYGDKGNEPALRKNLAFSVWKSARGFYIGQKEN